MMILMVLALICSGLFALGYYLGNQLGRTAHVREDIRRAREAHMIVRIDN
jgi:hypothetical protein